MLSKWIVVSISAALVGGVCFALATDPGAQVIIYVEDPEGTMRGRSSCEPCNRLVRDLTENWKTAGNRYICGTGRDRLFRVLKAPAHIKVFPSIHFPGKTPIEGYVISHARLVNLHPLSKLIKPYKPKPEKKE